MVKSNGYSHQLAERTGDGWKALGFFRSGTKCRNAIYRIETFLKDSGHKAASVKGKFTCIRTSEDEFKLKDSVIYYENKAFPLDPDTIELIDGSMVQVKLDS